MNLEQQIESAKQTVAAFESDIRSPQRIQAAIKHREEQQDRLQREIVELRHSATRLPMLHKRAVATLKELLDKKAQSDNKQLQELLRLQKRVNAQIKEIQNANPVEVKRSSAK